jgi:hypothetical protein
LERWRERPQMRTIPLTKGKCAIVDDEDFEWLNKFNWSAYFDGHNWYADRYRGIKMHREIMGLKKGDSIKVDHINHDTLDNQRHNLRLCSQCQNNCNRAANKKSTSMFKGVSWKKGKLYKNRQYNGIWVAQIKVGSKSIHIGQFVNEIEAAKAYDGMAKKYHGEFAYLNFRTNAALKKQIEEMKQLTP